MLKNEGVQASRCISPVKYTAYVTWFDVGHSMEGEPPEAAEATERKEDVGKIVGCHR
jgi:hypothetical protein